MRLNRLTELGLTEAQIRDNLMFTGDKVGETMKTAMSAKESKTWFGVAPPDLSVVARSRGPDWLYTYLRTFYRDPKTVTGWNNAVFPNVAMPHALWSLQGVQSLEAVEAKDLAGHEHIQYKWSQISQGTLTPIEYDALARDLVNFLVYAGEPAANDRRAIGIVVLFALGLLFIFVYLLKQEFWKDVK
jgi:ubiquinol-cytochrome c reductase cytochrome c1 subunit